MQQKLTAGDDLVGVDMRFLPLTAYEYPLPLREIDKVGERIA